MQCAALLGEKPGWTLTATAGEDPFALTAKVKTVTLNDPDAGHIATSVVIGEDAVLNMPPWQVKKSGKLVTP